MHLKIISDVVFLIHNPHFITSEIVDNIVTVMLSITDAMGIGVSETLVSVVTFTDVTREVFGFNQYQTKETLLSAIKNLTDIIVPSSGITATFTVLQQVQPIFQRQGKYLIIFLLEESVSPGQTLFAAFGLKSTGIILTVIGIGDRLTAESPEPRNYIATSPDHYLYASHSNHICSFVPDVLLILGKYVVTYGVLIQLSCPDLSQEAHVKSFTLLHDNFI